MKKILFGILLTLSLVVLPVSSCFAYEGEAPDEFVSRVFYGTSWGWLGTTMVTQFSEEKVQVTSIDACDVINEEAAISLYFVPTDEHMTANLTATNLVVFSSDGGYMVAVAQPY